MLRFSGKNVKIFICNPGSQNRTSKMANKENNMADDFQFLGSADDDENGDSSNQLIAGTWACRQCTLVNPAINSACDVCGTANITKDVSKG